MLERVNNVSCTEDKMVNTPECIDCSTGIEVQYCSSSIDRRRFEDSVQLNDAHNQYFSSDESQWTLLADKEQPDITWQAVSDGPCCSPNGDNLSWDNKLKRTHSCLKTSKGRECLVDEDSPQIREDLGKKKR